MKKVVVGFVSATALATISLAMAGGMTSMAASDQSSMSNVSGVYIGGNAGYGKVNFINPAVNASNPPLTKNLSGFAWSGDLGYQFNQYFAVESGYTSFHSFNVPQGTIRTYGIDLLAKGILPINEQFNVFAKAGAMNLYTKQINTATTLANHSRIVPEFGVGTSYNVNSNVALTLEGLTTLKMTGSNAMPATYVGLAGMSYKFNV